MAYSFVKTAKECYESMCSKFKIDDGFEIEFNGNKDLIVVNKDRFSIPHATRVHREAINKSAY